MSIAQEIQQAITNLTSEDTFRQPFTGAIISHIVSYFGFVSLGIEARHVVAVQCLSGYSWGRHFVCPQWQPASRYAGIRQAYTEESELYIPPTGNLDVARCRDQIDLARMNRQLNVNNLHIRKSLPLWRWGIAQHGLVWTAIYGVLFSFFLQPILLSLAPTFLQDTSYSTTSIWLLWLTSQISSLVSSIFTFDMYHVNRKIEYVLIPEDKWEGAAAEQRSSGPPLTVDEALNDVRQGRCRKHVSTRGDECAIPAIAVRPKRSPRRIDQYQIFLVALRLVLSALPYRFALLEGAGPVAANFVKIGMVGAALQLYAQNYCLNQYFSDLRTAGILWFRKMEAPDPYTNIRYALASDDNPAWQFSI